MEMTKQDTLNYYRIAEAINYIRENFKEQPDLDKVAEKINISPFHFQRLFSDWAGISPKKFLQYLNVEHSKKLLQKKETTLIDAAEQTGLSGTGRLHDLFVTMEGMTPGEYKKGGEGLRINYSFSNTLFGRVLVASTSKGICKLAFTNEDTDVFEELKSTFKHANYSERSDAFQENALSIFSQDWNKPKNIKLHLKGTDFQVKVWQALLNIPLGNLSSYGSVATAIGHPKASRAVGSAIGNNPVAFVIPCHRVVQASGLPGQYRWGSTRKRLMIGWETALQDKLVL